MSNSISAGFWTRGYNLFPCQFNLSLSLFLCLHFFFLYPNPITNFILFVTALFCFSLYCCCFWHLLVFAHLVYHDLDISEEKQLVLFFSSKVLTYLLNCFEIIFYLLFTGCIKNIKINKTWHHWYPTSFSEFWRKKKRFDCKIIIENSKICWASGINFFCIAKLIDRKIFFSNLSVLQVFNL